MHDIDSVLSLVSDVKASLPSLVGRYLPRIRTVPLYQGMKWILADGALY